MAVVKDLRDIRAVDADSAGGKGANLGELARNSGHPADALGEYTRAVQLLEDLSRRHPHDGGIAPYLLNQAVARALLPVASSVSSSWVSAESATGIFAKSIS